MNDVPIGRNRISPINMFMLFLLALNYTSYWISIMIVYECGSGSDLINDASYSNKNVKNKRIFTHKNLFPSTPWYLYKTVTLN